MCERNSSMTSHSPLTTEPRCITGSTMKAPRCSSSGRQASCSRFSRAPPSMMRVCLAVLTRVPVVTCECSKVVRMIVG